MPQMTGSPLLRTALVAAATVAAVSLFARAWTVHLQRACWVADTPYIDICPSEANRDKASVLAALRLHLRKNPGDAGAYIKLALESPASVQQRPLRAASILAPNDPEVLRLEAMRALQEERLPEAVGKLVHLAEFYFHLVPESARVLALLVADGRGAALLRPYLAPGTRWLKLVLDRMAHEKLPISAALPLVREALPKGILAPEAISKIIAGLKESGAWADAYAIWAGQNGGRLPLLFNAGFEKPFNGDGFDWEVSYLPLSRTGAVVGRSRFTGRGYVLDIEYTGRAVQSPVIRQYLFLAPGTYRLTGRYRAVRFRSEEGLAWIVRCVRTSDRVAGRSRALQDTRGSWEDFGVEVAIPPDCGPVASLQLETFAPFEAKAGLKGRVTFDAFTLERR